MKSRGNGAFRRLSNKTQLFPGDESDFFRNRLTHSLEVAQIAKSIGQKLNSEHDFFKEQKYRFGFT
jgi:dGTPase